MHSGDGNITTVVTLYAMTTNPCTIGRAGAIRDAAGTSASHESHPTLSVEGRACRLLIDRVGIDRTKEPAPGMAYRGIPGMVPASVSLELNQPTKQRRPRASIHRTRHPMDHEDGAGRWGLNDSAPESPPAGGWIPEHVPLRRVPAPPQHQRGAL